MLEQHSEFDLYILGSVHHLTLAVAFRRSFQNAAVLPHSFLVLPRNDRMKAACSMYILQNAAVAASALTAWVSLKSSQGSALFWIGAVSTIASGSISSIGSQGSMLSVEKEWTTALCGSDSAALAKFNSGTELT